ncbi:MAG: hypothetical protein ACKVS8_12210 [Phycisphaerales bacterium]
MVLKRVVLPLLVVAVGLGWLLTNLHIIPGVNWLWTGGLGVVGLLTLALSGIDRFSVVVGPFFVLASIASILRQTGRLSVDIEVPGLFIAFGVLWLLAMLLPLKQPSWLLQPPAG